MGAVLKGVPWKVLMPAARQAVGVDVAVPVGAFSMSLNFKSGGQLLWSPGNARDQEDVIDEARKVLQKPPAPTVMPVMV